MDRTAHTLDFNGHLTEFKPEYLSLFNAVNLEKKFNRINRHLDDNAFRNVSLGQNYLRLLGLDYTAPRCIQLNRSDSGRRVVVQ